MPTRKQRRRREKQLRHEWEEVYVDEEGRELDPDEVEELAPDAHARSAGGKAAKAQQKQRGARRPIEPPSLRRTLRRGLLFFPLMLLVIFLIPTDAEVTTAQKVVQGIFLLLVFLPFSYFVDGLLWRSYQRRIAKSADEKKR